MQVCIIVCMSHPRTLTADQDDGIEVDAVHSRPDKPMEDGEVAKLVEHSVSKTKITQFKLEQSDHRC